MLIWILSIVLLATQRIIRKREGDEYGTGFYDGLLSVEIIVPLLVVIDIFLKRP